MTGMGKLALWSACLLLLCIQPAVASVSPSDSCDVQSLMDEYAHETSAADGQMVASAESVLPPDSANALSVPAQATRPGHATSLTSTSETSTTMTASAVTATPATTDTPVQRSGESAQTKLPDASLVRRDAGGSMQGMTVVDAAKLKTRHGAITVKTEMGKPFVWKHAGGDPAGLPLSSQILHLPVWQDVQDQWLLQAQTVVPDTVWVVSTKERPYNVSGITFGGRKTSVFTIRGPVKLDLVNPKTGQHVDSLRALIWPSVSYDNEYYTLLQFLVCSNAAWLVCEAQPEHPAPPPSKSELPPRETPPKKAPPREAPPRTVPPTDIPYNPGEAANWVMNGTAYTTLEYVDGQNDGDHANLFGGTELVVHKSYGNTFGYVFRLGGGALGAPNAKGDFQTAGGFARIGIRHPIFKPTAWEANLEAGGYGQAEQLVWRDVQTISPSLTHWQDRRSTSPDFGGYLRTIGYGPQEIGWDARIATGQTLKRETEAEASISPWFLVLKGSLHDSQRRARDVHANGRGFTFPASVFRTHEASVGVQLKGNQVLAVGWNEWKYHSPIWDFDWQGPSLAYDWKINIPWRVRAQVIRFSNTRELDLQTGQRYTNDHLRFNVGANYDF